MNKGKRLRVLTAGLDAAEIASRSFGCHIVRAPTLRDAGGELKRNRFDVVIVKADCSKEGNIVWVERLRAAKPYLAVLVLADSHMVDLETEARLMQAGIAGIMDAGTENWRTWLAEMVGLA